METGSLNLPEPSGPHRAVMGLLYLYLYVVYIDIYRVFNLQVGRILI
jgi:hypothetical protein